MKRLMAALFSLTLLLGLAFMTTPAQAAPHACKLAKPGDTGTQTVIPCGGPEVTVSIDTELCVLNVSFFIPNEVPAKRARLVSTGYYLLIQELGVVEELPYGSGERQYPLSGVELGTLIIAAITNGYEVEWYTYASNAVEMPVECQSPVSGSTADCPYPPSPLRGMALIPNDNTRTFFAPRLNAQTTGAGIVNLARGTTWWVLEARDGFYKLFITCYGQYVWVVASDVTPNPAAPWNGRALPDAGELPQ